MSVLSLSRSHQNYLKAIWSVAEWNDDPVSSKAVATRVGVSASTASEALDKLQKMGLVDKEPYSSLGLTEQGRIYALEMVRRHRLIETFLVQELDYRWDQVHAEAEVLEHAASDFMIERIAEKLNHPTRDPHGDPIPAADGTLPEVDAQRLDTVTEFPATVRVERICDDDPKLLQYLEDHNIAYGSELTITQKDTYSEQLQLTAEGVELSLGPSACQDVWVKVL